METGARLAVHFTLTVVDDTYVCSTRLPRPMQDAKTLSSVSPAIQLDVPARAMMEAHAIDAAAMDGGGGGGAGGVSRASSRAQILVSLQAHRSPLKLTEPSTMLQPPTPQVSALTPLSPDPRPTSPTTSRPPRSLRKSCTTKRDLRMPCIERVYYYLDEHNKRKHSRITVSHARHSKYTCQRNE